MISGEPSSMRLIYGGSRGLIWLQVRVEAEGGHSAKPHLGRSAIKEMRTLLDHLEHEIETLPVNVAPEIRDVVEAAKPVTDDLAGDGATDGLLRITTNVGTVTGGLAVNMLAESCEARVDIRFLPGVEIEQLLDTVTRVVSEHRGASFEVIRQTAACFGDPSATIYRAIAKATADVSGTAAALTLSHATGDNRLWLYAGVPTAMLGPTAIRVGSANEYVEIDDLLSVTKVHARPPPHTSPEPPERHSAASRPLRVPPQTLHQLAPLALREAAIFLIDAVAREETLDHIETFC